MAVFKSEKYPALSLHDGETEWARFVGGSFESTDVDVVKRLRSKGAVDLGVSEEKPAKSKSE
jgi:hypothetical protein